MSEPKRVSFQTITSTTATTATVSGIGGSGSFATSSSTSTMSSMRFGYNLFSEDVCAASNGDDGTSGGTSLQNNKSSPEKTFRLKLKLFQSDSSSYPEFNYSKLVHLEKKKIKKLKQKTNGFDDLCTTNDDDVERIAKELEQKYGGAYGGGRSLSRKDDKSDLGMGYDVSDSFIDNTEAYDEILPEEMEAKEGGFYINSGALVFKSLYNEPVKTKTDEIIKMPNRPKKRVLSSSSEESSSDDDNDDDDDDNENDDGDNDDEDDDTDEDDVATDCSKGKTIQKEKRLKQDTTAISVAKKSQDDEKKARDKKGVQSQSYSLSNSPKPSMEETCFDSDKDRMRQKTVKTTTVKDMLKAKRDNFLKMQEFSGTSSSVCDTRNVNGEIKGVTSKSSDDESTEDDDDDDGDSEDGEDNSDSNQSSAPTQGKDVKRATNFDDSSEKLRISDTKLPELDSEIAVSIQEFKDIAKSKNLIGKRFQFDENLTDVFLKIDESLLCIERSQRNMVFAHLEFDLLLPKYYFLRKAKQLRIKEEKLKSKRALGKLRKAVIEAMPGAISGYEVDLRKVSEIQSGIINPEQLTKMPKKKFPWDSNLRNLLYDVYQVRWTSYPVLRTRKETLEDFINIFMRDKVVELWPSGWMRYEELQKEIERRKTVTKKAKEKKKHCGSSALSATGASETVGDGLCTANDGSFGKQQEESVSSGRSCANSDTDSVASSGNSSALKRKTTDLKQSKAKSQKYFNEKLQASNESDGIAMTQTKRTEHNAYIGAATSESASSTSCATTPTTATGANAVYSTSNAANTYNSGILNNPSTPSQVDSQNKHSTMARPYAHVIDLDKYKSTNDILQTSKKIVHNTALTGPTGAGYFHSNALDNTNIRRSSSDSDGVEIVGVFQAGPMPPHITTTVAKQKHKRNGSRSVTPFTQTNSFPNDLHVNLFGAQASSSTSTATAIFMKTSPTANAINKNNNNSNNNSNSNNNHKRSSLTTSSTATPTLPNFDASKVKTLKELIPQSVSAKAHNQ